jgi:uncharacterized membrane protein YagU involved in acid resistance
VLWRTGRDGDSPPTVDSDIGVEVVRGGSITFPPISGDLVFPGEWFSRATEVLDAAATKRHRFTRQLYRSALSTPTRIASLKARAFLTIFSAGIVAGLLDITAAFVTWAPRGVRPAQILRGIASGLLGPTSFTDGWQTAALGAVLHFLIAFSAAAVFYGASRKLKFMTRRSVVSGVIYGIAVYVFMYWVVLPLSAYHRPAFSISATIVAIVTHIICVGLPISLIARRYSIAPTHLSL